MAKAGMMGSLGHCALRVLALTALACATPAAAWTRPGHMVTAAIAYRELRASDPAILDAIVAILAQHSDPGPFQVAIGREEGESRAIRLFLEAVRWPDDIRGGPLDHSYWHISVRPILASPGSHADYETRGVALPALALSEGLARDSTAAPAERAVALCWIMHLVGDMHQPLHSSEYFSDHWPHGDGGGSKTYVLDPETGKPITLHWFWDDSVNRAADADSAMRKADELMARLPRAHFAAALAGDKGKADNVEHWIGESRDLARSLAYRADAPTALSPETAVPAAPAYLADTKAAAAERVTLAGYRLADLLRSLFKR